MHLAATSMLLALHLHGGWPEAHGADKADDVGEAAGAANEMLRDILGLEAGWRQQGLCYMEHLQ